MELSRAPRGAGAGGGCWIRFHMLKKRVYTVIDFLLSLLDRYYENADQIWRDGASNANATRRSSVFMFLMFRWRTFWPVVVFVHLIYWFLIFILFLILLKIHHVLLRVRSCLIMLLMLVVYMSSYPLCSKTNTSIILILWAFLREECGHGDRYLKTKHSLTVLHIHTAWSDMHFRWLWTVFKMVALDDLML